MPKKGPSTIEDRLHRVAGQIRGIEDMVERGDETKKIVTQIRAAISSLESVKVCLVKKEITENITEQFEDLAKML